MNSKFLFAFAAVLCGSTLLSGAENTVEFDPGKALAANKKCILPHRPEKGQAVEAVTMEDKQILRVEFNCEETPWCQIFCYGKAFAIPGTFSKATVKVPVYTDADSNLQNVRLILMDKDGESFQYNGNFNSAKTGWQEVSFPVDAAKSKNSWGGKGKANKKIDFPVHFRGFTFNYKSKNGVGEAKIGKITVEVQ